MIGADLRNPWQLSFGRNDVAKQRLQTCFADRHIVVDKKDRNLTALALCTLFQTQQLFDDAVVGAKSYRVTEETSHRTKLAAVRAATTRLDRYDEKLAPALAKFG